MKGDWSDVYRSQIKERIQQHVGHLAQGGAHDLPEYKRLCGLIEGLSMAERDFGEMMSRIEGEEDVSE